MDRVSKVSNLLAGVAVVGLATYFTFSSNVAMPVMLYVGFLALLFVAVKIVSMGD